MNDHIYTVALTAASLLGVMLGWDDDGRYIQQMLLILSGFIQAGVVVICAEARKE
jgi:hypothetical protein